LQGYDETQKYWGKIRDNSDGFPPVLGTDWCGEHPDFPAYLESLKPVEITDKPSLPRLGSGFRMEDGTFSNATHYLTLDGHEIYSSKSERDVELFAAELMANSKVPLR
jgi:hypothetical protein